MNEIKVNAVRTNDEANIIYHAELLGNGSTFYPSINLTPTYIEYVTKDYIDKRIAEMIASA